MPSVGCRYVCVCVCLAMLMCTAVVAGAPSTVLMPERYRVTLETTIPKKVAEPVPKVTQPGPVAVAVARSGQTVISPGQQTMAPFNVQRANAVSEPYAPPVQRSMTVRAPSPPPADEGREAKRVRGEDDMS